MKNVMRHVKSVTLLRYYATFKVRKFDSLFYKIDTCLQRTTTSNGLKSKQIFSVNIWCIFFNFGRGFCDSFSMLFPQVSAFCDTKNWNKFWCIVLLFACAQKVSQIFKILFQKGDIKNALSGLRKFLATESPLKMMKNVFYFISKALFVLKIFKFLSWLFGHVSERLD